MVVVGLDVAFVVLETLNELRERLVERVEVLRLVNKELLGKVDQAVAESLGKNVVGLQELVAQREVLVVL